jgi:hypothetical protein
LGNKKTLASQANLGSVAKVLVSVAKVLVSVAKVLVSVAKVLGSAGQTRLSVASKPYRID